MSSPAIMVVTIGRILLLSKMMPRMPRTKAAGTESIIANPPRAAIGLPQPGRRMKSIAITMGATASKAAEIFPRRIFGILKQCYDIKLLYRQLGADSNRIIF